MHQDFADWYRVASIDPQQVPLEARWKGIGNFSDDLDKSAALDVVRLYFNKPTHAPDFEESFRAAFKNADNAFAMRGNDVEMQILAGATVVNLLNIDDVDLADAVALAVVCADFRGLRVRPILGEVIDLAEGYLHEQSGKLRTQLNTPSIKPLKPKPADYSGQVKTALETSVQNGVNAIVPLLDKLSNLPDRLIEPINEALQTLSNQIRLQQEESNILWWMFSESSRDLHKTIKRIGHPAAGLVVGKELGDLTLMLPGPLAAEAFIDKMLQPLSRNGKHKDITISEAVNAKELSEWKIRENKGELLNGLEDLCQIHFALRQSAEDENWIASFERRSGIKADSAISPQDLAMQIYQERLLIKAME